MNDIAVQQNQKMVTFRSVLKKQLPQIEKLLQNKMQVSKVERIILTTVSKNPKLLECTSASILGCIMEICELGLDTGVQGHTYLIPFYNNKKKQYECQFILGYKGMRELIYRSGKVSSIDGIAVYEKDYFKIEYGTDPYIKHIPHLEKDRGKVIGFYIVAFLNDRNGKPPFKFMPKHEIDPYKKDSTFWNNHYESMALKTVLRKLFKFAPSSSEVEKAIALDEQAEAGEQDNGHYFEHEEQVVVTQSREEELMQQIENKI